MQLLTSRQAEILEFLKEKIIEGWIPSFRDIMKEFKFKSIKAVQDHLKVLEEKGYIKRDPHKARSIEVLGLRRLDTVELPIVGRIAAGCPILTEENLEGTVAIDKSWVKEKNSFVLKVHGESMIDAGIHDGDYVIVQQNYWADNRDIVVAMIDNEVTLKRFIEKGENIILQPENQTMQPIVIKKGTVGFTIIGKVTGVYRKLVV